MTHRFIHRSRNYEDLEPIVEELGAIYGKKTLLQIYHEAASDGYSFLHVILMNRDKRKMIMERSQRCLIPS